MTKRTIALAWLWLMTGFGFIWGIVQMFAHVPAESGTSPERSRL